MRGEAEEETATATGRAVRHLTQEPTPLPQVLARRDKVDPKTLAVNGGPLITSQPGDKDHISSLCTISLHIRHRKLSSFPPPLHRFK